jgi:hypothetical protein
LCHPSLNLTNLTNCDERSSSSSIADTETTDNLQPENTETPLIIPDISPTGKDLEDATTDGDRDTTVTDATNDDNDDNSENPDTDRDSSSNEGESSDSKTSLIPFP